jgi:cytidine deaminase
METTMEDLLKAAEQARRAAYAPYSNFRVGAALEAEDGRIFTGANIENASYGLTICAERVAIFRAIHAGAARGSFRRIVVCTDQAELTPPCGACRQVMIELAGPELAVVMHSTQGHSETLRLEDLLPRAFVPESLGR